MIALETIEKVTAVCFGSVGVLLLVGFGVFVKDKITGRERGNQ